MKFLDCKHLLAVPSEPKDLSTEITRRFHVKSCQVPDPEVVPGKPRALAAQPPASHRQQHLQHPRTGQKRNVSGPPRPSAPKHTF